MSYIVLLFLYMRYLICRNIMNMVNEQFCQLTKIKSKKNQLNL